LDKNNKDLAIRNRLQDSKTTTKCRDRDSLYKLLFYICCLMKRLNKIGIILLVAFMGMLAMPLISAPEAIPYDHHKYDLAFFENGDEHTSQWLIRSVSESEEFNVRTTTVDSNHIFFFNCCIRHHSNVHKVRFIQFNRQKDIKVPKEHIYLSNSCFTI
jgi:hypothetical protein